MSWYILIKFLHIVAALMLVGGMFARQLVRGAAKKTADVHSVATLLRAARQIDTIMVIPGSNAAIVLGVILALVSGTPIFGFLQGASQNWLLLANLLLVSGLVLVAAVFVPGNKKLEPILQAALAEGQLTPALQAAIDDKMLRLAHRYEELSIIAVVALMVFKPF